MLEDRLLIWKFRRGSSDALSRIYGKYSKDLLRLAYALLNDAAAAEDIVHDFFLWFAQSPERLKLGGNLKAYLATCVVNRARNLLKARQRGPVSLDGTDPIPSSVKRPDQWIIASEQARRVNAALAELPLEQREVVALHLQGGMRFKAVADLQGVSINTVQSRYRYGLKKLRSLLDSEVE